MTPENPAVPPGRPEARIAGSAAAACGALLLALLPGPARAVLGEAAASIQADQVRSHAQHRQAPLQLSSQAHVLQRADGSRITEYVGPDGRVYAVSWQGGLKPDLAALLGRHYAAYQAGVAGSAANPSGRRVMRRTMEIRQGDLVVRERTNLNLHAGIAYLASQVPAEIAPDALR